MTYQLPNNVILNHSAVELQLQLLSVKKFFIHMTGHFHIGQMSMAGAVATLATVSH